MGLGLGLRMKLGWGPEPAGGDMWRWRGVQQGIGGREGWRDGGMGGHCGETAGVMLGDAGG